MTRSKPASSSDPDRHMRAMSARTSARAALASSSAKSAAATAAATAGAAMPRKRALPSNGHVKEEEQGEEGLEGGEGSAATKRRKGPRALFAPSPANVAPPVAVKGEEEGQEGKKENGTSPYKVLRRSTRASTSMAWAGTDAGAGATESMAVDDVLEEEKKPVKGVKKEAKDPFSTSPRKAPSKPIKLELEAHEARPAPKRWREQLAILNEQRKRIVAPVDTMGCEENGRDDRRGDVQRVQDGVESEEDKRKRERFTILISLMLSSQTKDPVTAEAVRNLQTRLDGGLSLESLLAAPQDLITECIAKVGFWRRKTGYITSAAKILKEDFGGDVPKTIDELCSLPGVGPKMSFLALQSAWGLNVGIGVDVHVHRVTNRLNWVKSQDPEGTRLQLQSWLPKELHKTINKTLVGFGQVVCLPVGPRCDLCALGAARMCPSYRKVDPKSVLKRVKVEFLPEGTQHPSDARVKPEVEEAIKVEGPDGAGVLLEDKDAVQAATGIKTEAAVKEESLDW